jgi:hypothetical protein
MEERALKAQLGNFNQLKTLSLNISIIAMRQVLKINLAKLESLSP